MTRVCLLGADDVDLRVDLLSYETARDALSAYDLEEPYANALALDTISLGAAVSLLNDLAWYRARLVEAALVLEPSVSETEWLSRDLAAAIRNEAIEPEASGEYLRIYGVDRGPDGGGEGSRRPELTEPMYARRTDGEVPAYDLRDAEDTLVVRVTEAEFA